MNNKKTLLGINLSVEVSIWNKNKGLESFAINTNSGLVIVEFVYDKKQVNMVKFSEWICIDDKDVFDYYDELDPDYYIGIKCDDNQSDDVTRFHLIYGFCECLITKLTGQCSIADVQALALSYIDEINLDFYYPKNMSNMLNDSNKLNQSHYSYIKYIYNSSLLNMKYYLDVYNSLFPKSYFNHSIMDRVLIGIIFSRLDFTKDNFELEVINNQYKNIINVI